jgi:hypothetical protein
MEDAWANRVSASPPTTGLVSKAVRGRGCARPGAPLEATKHTDKGVPSERRPRAAWQIGQSAKQVLCTPAHR